MARKLIVEIVGDSRSLERSFKRSEKAAQGFGASIDRSAKKMSGFQRGALTGFVGAAAFSSAIAGLRDVIGLAAESEQVLGQTRVALESTGISWARYGEKIEAAIKTQSEFGFDDEALLQSFSLFVRQSDSVSEALRRNQIAMDLARARFIDLEQAALLVNKAALGQAGALRRVGIDARTGASGVELLTQLEREFGGAAARASDDAATAMDRLAVQTENAKESLGTLALPVVTNLVTVLTQAATAAEKLTDRLGGLERKSDRLSLGDLFAPITELPGIIKKSFTPPWKWDDLTEGMTGGLEAAGLVEDIRQFHADVKGAVEEGAKGPSQTLRNRWFDNLIGRAQERAQDIPTLRGQIARLKEIAQLISERMKVTKDITRRLNLEDDLLRVQRDIRSRQAEIAANAAEAARAAKARQEELAQAARERAEAARERAAQARELKFGWLEFAVERAEATKGIKDDLKAFGAIEDFLQARIRQEGRTLDLVRELWRVQQRIKDASNKTGEDDPLAGLRQVSTQRLAAQLGAGTGLAGTGRRRLAFNVSGAQIQLYNSIQVDSREIARASTIGQTRSGKRTAAQTSGRRG